MPWSAGSCLDGDPAPRGKCFSLGIDLDLPSHPQGQLRGLSDIFSFGLCLIFPGFSTQARIALSKYLLRGMEDRGINLPTPPIPGPAVSSQTAYLYKSERIIPQSLRGEGRVFDLGGCPKISTPPMEKDLKTSFHLAPVLHIVQAVGSIKV